MEILKFSEYCFLFSEYLTINMQDTIVHYIYLCTQVLLVRVSSCFFLVYYGDNENLVILVPCINFKINTVFMLLTL